MKQKLPQNSIPKQEVIHIGRQVKNILRYAAIATTLHAYIFFLEKKQKQKNQPENTFQHIRV